MFPALGSVLDAHGAQRVDLALAVDGNLITGRSMGASISFALALIARLISPERAIEIARSIYYDGFSAADAAAFASDSDK